MRQEQVQDIFIRAVFGKRRSVSSTVDTPSATDGGKVTEDKGSDVGTSLPEPVRIIHKEQDSISAFCLNQVTNRSVCKCVMFLLPLLIESQLCDEILYFWYFDIMLNDWGLIPEF